MKLVLGTAQLGLNYGINNSNGKPSQKIAYEILNRAFQLGIDELDTADAYGNSSEIISSYLISNPTQKFKIMSKYITEGRITYQQAFESSCKKLGIKYLDGYYFHRFQDFKSFNDFDYIQKLKQCGQLGKFAVSLYSLDELELAVHSRDIDLIQLPVNVFDCSEKKIELLKLAQVSGKKIYARSVFLQGLFFKDLDTLPPKLVPLRKTLIELHNLTNRYNVTMEDLCLSFVAGLDCVDKIVIGIDSVDQLEKNVKSLDCQLPKGLMKEILKIEINYPDLINPANWNN